MADNHRNTRRPTNQAGEVSTNIQLALDKQLADLKQLLETSPALPSTEVAYIEAYEVRLSITTSKQVPISFPGCLPKFSCNRYICFALRSQQPHRQDMGPSAQTRT